MDYSILSTIGSARPVEFHNSAASRTNRVLTGPMKPKHVKSAGWCSDTFHEGRVVVMNKDSEAVPKDMPGRLWYTDGIREYMFEIQSWRLNVAEPPKLEKFPKPETRPGWEVKEWPFGSEK